MIFNPNVDQRGNHPAGFQHGIPSRVSRVHEVVRLEGHHEAAHCRQTRRSQIQLQAMPKGINISFILIISQPSGILLSRSFYLGIQVLIRPSFASEEETQQRIEGG